MVTRAWITTILALVSSLCILIGVQGVSSAQTTPTVDGTITKEEAYRLKKLFEAPSGTSGSEIAERRASMTKASRARLLGLSRATIVRGGLAGAAAGIWIHNGVTLYYGLQGQPDPVPLYLSPEFRQAEIFLEGQSGGGGVTRYYDSNNVLTGSGMILSATYTFSAPDTVTVTYGYAGTSTTPGGLFGAYGLRSEDHISSNYPDGSGGYQSASDTTTNTRTFTGSIPSTPSKQGRFYTRDTRGPNASEYRFFGPTITEGQSTTWTNPVYDLQPATILDAPPSGGSIYDAQPEQTEQFLRDVQAEGCPTGTVAVPEAPTIPEVCPDYFPAEWEEEFEEEVKPSPGESPYDDPDQDGKPNHEDDDDDGDEIPDREDETPFVPAPESPAGDPDEDGTPNRDDQDDDGDGIPDTDDPQPYAPTVPGDLPADHPYADPDGDEIPNRDDPDDDGDGIPDTDDPDPTEETPPSALPMWHPFADPDTDGIPNREDRDDDQDEREDWQDQRPYTPSSIPDQDTDEDTVPDELDPWPGNPYAPADPDADRDGDGAPDYSDPEVTNPGSPWGDPESVPERRTGPQEDPDTPPEANPWGTPATGNPNVPSAPSNPAYPPSSPGTTDPPDQSTGLDSPPPTSSGQPDDPTTPGEPDDPDEGQPSDGSGEPPPGDGGACRSIEPYRFDLPDFELFNVFPFSLVLKAWSIMQSLVATPERPTFDIPIVGEVPIPESADSTIKAMRATIAIVLTVGMCFWFWRMVTGRGSDNAG